MPFVPKPAQRSTNLWAAAQEEAWLKMSKELLAEPWKILECLWRNWTRNKKLSLKEREHWSGFTKRSTCSLTFRFAVMRNRVNIRPINCHDRVIALKKNYIDFCPHLKEEDEERCVLHVLFSYLVAKPYHRARPEVTAATQRPSFKQKRLSNYHLLATCQCQRLNHWRLRQAAK